MHIDKFQAMQSPRKVTAIGEHPQRLAPISIQHTALPPLHVEELVTVKGLNDCLRKYLPKLENAPYLGEEITPLCHTGPNPQECPSSWRAENDCKFAEGNPSCSPRDSRQAENTQASRRNAQALELMFINFVAPLFKPAKASTRPNRTEVQAEEKSGAELVDGMSKCPLDSLNIHGKAFPVLPNISKGMQNADHKMPHVPPEENIVNSKLMKVQSDNAKPLVDIISVSKGLTQNKRDKIKPKLVLPKSLLPELDHQKSRSLKPIPELKKVKGKLVKSVTESDKIKLRRTKALPELKPKSEPVNKFGPSLQVSATKLGRVKPVVAESQINKDQVEPQADEDEVIKPESREIEPRPDRAEPEVDRPENNGVINAVRFIDNYMGDLIEEDDSEIRRITNTPESDDGFASAEDESDDDDDDARGFPVMPWNILPHPRVTQVQRSGIDGGIRFAHKRSLRAARLPEEEGIPLTESGQFARAHTRLEWRSTLDMIRWAHRHHRPGTYAQRRPALEHYLVKRRQNKPDNENS